MEGHEYYGPKPDAISNINELLGLETTGREQDWEFELADAGRIGEMLDLLDFGGLDLDSRSALSLLLTASVEEAEQAGSLDENLLMRAASIFSRDEVVQRRVEFFWLNVIGDETPSSVRRVVFSAR